ncbi:MAG TPA: hypothetical protein VGK00_07720 [Anaerolineales bacterium]|jgi:hypothetical protein
MSLQFDDKGKYFTDIISKTAVPAIIQTTLHRIEGFVHVRAGGRLKDELDLNELFLAVTNARVLGLDGSLVHETDFISIARAQIIWVALTENSNNPGDN